MAVPLMIIVAVAILVFVPVAPGRCVIRWVGPQQWAGHHQRQREYGQCEQFVHVPRS
jgi:hypothetical protein